uniref:Uncharacterized protein n=1 Tax=Syphacia muris TaxID=451379 RepID=A0A0N5B1D5_9BILA
MSGSIRRSVAPTLKRLQDFLHEILELPITGEEANTSKTYDDYLRKVRTHLIQPKRSVGFLENYNNRWLDILATLKGEDLKKEQATYDAMADDPEGLINIVEQASVRRGYLEADIAEAERASNRNYNSKSASCKRELNITNMTNSIRNENERTLPSSLHTMGQTNEIRLQQASVINRVLMSKDRKTSPNSDNGAIAMVKFQKPQQVLVLRHPTRL